MECPICGTSGCHLLYPLPEGPIHSCRDCKTVFRGNLVAGEAAKQLYDADSYLDSTFFDVLKVGAKTDVEPYLLYGKVLDRLEDGQSEGGQGRLLDVGCSYGAFLEMARDRGWQVQGVELSSKSSQYATEKRNLEVFTGTLEEASYPANHFSAITLWDVIEHLHRPVETLKEVWRILEPGGLLVMFTINQKSLFNRVGDLLYRVSFGRFRQPVIDLYPLVHNYFFDRKTLAYAARAGGFEGPIEVDWQGANLDRWQTEPVPLLSALVADGLDFASRWVGERYRMIFYVSK